MQQAMIDPSQLARRYAGRGPRYTSYPTAAQFGPLTADVYEERLGCAAAREREPWSVYVHVPFCEQRCHFCACAVISTPQHDRVAPGYVEDLIRVVDSVLRCDPMAGVPSVVVSARKVDPAV